VVSHERQQLLLLADDHRTACKAALARIAAAATSESESQGLALPGHWQLQQYEPPETLGSLALSTAPTLQPEVSEAADPVPEHPDAKETVPPVETTTSSKDLLLNVGRKRSEGSQMSVASAISLAEMTSARREAANVQSFDMFAAENDEIVPESPGGRGSASKSRTTNPSGAMDVFFSESQGSGWHRFQNRIKSFIDYGAAVLVLLNSVVLLLELEFEGSAIGGALGLIEGPDMEQVEPVFRLLDRFFVFVFTLELLMRLAVERSEFRKEWTNWLDVILVVLGLVDFYFSLQVESGDVVPKDIVLLRLVRALKSLRAFRMMRSFRLFRGLRLLVKACQCFLPSLCWAMVLLGVFMTMGALIMGNLLQSFLTDDTANFEDKEVIWLKYGTAYRAMYTLYEITFAGNWPTNSRPVLEKVSHAYVIFFVLYITVIAFAVIRVISAVFLKDTLDAAQNDAEHMVVDRLRKKAEYVEKLEIIFRAIDDSGDGIITEARMNEILSNQKIAAYFQTLDLDVHEGAALFHLLDNGDGEVTLEEFIDGIMRCKGPARAIDQVAMHADLKQLDAKMAKLLYAMGGGSSKKREKDKKNHLKAFRHDVSSAVPANFRNPKAA